jgi:hypothetical protein
MSVTVESFIDEYSRHYSERDVEGVTNMCLWPFLAIRSGVAINLPDRNAVREHVAGEMNAYRFAAGAGTWRPIKIEARELGESCTFATVHWNAQNVDGEVVRDSWTSFLLLATPDGWRFVSYVNHF